VAYDVLTVGLGGDVVALMTCGEEPVVGVAAVFGDSYRRIRDMLARGSQRVLWPYTPCVTSA